MANLTSTDVVVTRDFVDDGVSNSRRRVGRRRVSLWVSLTLGGQGTTTNTIPASALGLSRILSASGFVKSDNSVIVPSAPSADGSMLLLCAVTNATDATRAAPADFTGVFSGSVDGLL